jgi:GNAT superfamily N-acetyltransferase
MNADPPVLDLAAPGFRLTATLAPYDVEVFGFAIAQILVLEVAETSPADANYAIFEEWRDAHDMRIVSCRLPHDRLRESMFLERQGFRFVETVLHPVIDRLQRRNLPSDHLVVIDATEADLPALRSIAECAFHHERFHIDPRLDPRLGDLRYGRWVENSLHHPRQRLLKIMDGPRLLGFFIVEAENDGAVYWHLTAISPRWQGQGYGRRVWQTMLSLHRDEGHDRVVTTISARNIPVLNLYARLNASFLPPEMTFHWVRDSG